MDAIRRTLFASDTLQIGAFAARPVSDACGDVERQGINVVVLPVSGVFSRHDSLGRHVTGTPSHAVLVAADTPYRLSFPGAIGDGALICGSAKPWRLTGSIVTAAGRKRHHTGCFRLAP